MGCFYYFSCIKNNIKFDMLERNEYFCGFFVDMIWEKWESCFFTNANAGWGGKGNGKYQKEGTGNNRYTAINHKMLMWITHRYQRWEETLEKSEKITMSHITL